MSYWVKLIHSDTVIADTDCVLRNLSSIVLKTYSGKTLLAVDATGELLFCKDYTSTPLGYLASQTSDIRAQLEGGFGIISSEGEIVSVNFNSSKLGLSEYVEHTAIPSLDGLVEVVTDNGQFAYLNPSPSSNPNFFIYTPTVPAADTSMSFEYFSVRSGNMYMAFFQEPQGGGDSYLRLYSNYRYSSLNSKTISLTTSELSNLKYEPLDALPAYAVINYKNISTSVWHLCITPTDIDRRGTLSNTDVLRYLASEITFSTASVHTYTDIYLTAIVSGAVEFRKYQCDIVSSTVTVFTLTWSKELTLNGTSYDFIHAGVVKDDALILSLISSDGKDIHLCSFPKDCIKNGVYGDIVISDGSTTALGTADVPIALETRQVAVAVAPDANSTVTIGVQLALLPTISGLSVELCGSSSFTPEIPNRDAFVDFTDSFTGTVSYVEESNTFIAPTGVISAVFTCASYRTFFCRYLKVRYIVTATVANVKLRLYDTQGTIVGESLLQDLTTSGYLILSIKETGYALSYFILYKSSAEGLELSIELTVPTWSFPPQTNYGETRAYLTDVSNSKEGELRAVLRELPRTNLKYTNLFKTTPEFVQAKLVNEASVGGFISAPLWPDMTRITGLTQGDTIIPLTNLYHEWGVGTKVIIWGNYNTYEVSEITATSLGSITLADTLLRNYSVAYIMPLLSGITPAEISFQFNNNNRTADFNLLSTETYFEEGFNSPFIDLDGTVITDEFGEFLYPEATDFIGYPLLEGTLINDGISLSYNREGYVNDNEIGLLSKTDNELYTRESSSVSLVARTAEEVYLLKRKLDDLQGKFFAFWLPTKENDIQFSFTSLTSGATSFLAIFNQMAITQPKYIHITGDVEVVIKISHISNNYDGTETIHLLSALTTDILNITSIEVVHLMRSATDSFDIRYFNRSKAIVNFPVTSVTL